MVLTPDSIEPPLAAEPGRAATTWRHWAVSWWGVLVLAFVNGGLHRAYEPALGTLPAEQLSNATLVAVVVPWAFVVDGRHPTSSDGEALRAGLTWGALTVAFEFVGGHYLTGDSWGTLVRAYDVTAGHLWPLAIAGVTLAPLAARWWRVRR